MKHYLVLYRAGVCIEVSPYDNPDEAQKRLDKVLLNPDEGVSGTIISATGDPGVKVGDMTAADGTDDMDFAGLDA